MDMNDIFSSTPARPDVPDFWRLSEIILEMDGAMQAAHTDDEKEVVWKHYMGTHCNHDAIYYMALQRAMRILGCRTVGDVKANADELTKLTTVYTEGFLVGCQYKDRGGHRD